jgi:hypothetical protein
MGVYAYLRPDDHEAGVRWVEGLPVGRVRLEFKAEGFEPKALEVDVKPGLTVPAEVRLDPK